MKKEKIGIMIVILVVVVGVLLWKRANEMVIQKKNETLCEDIEAKIGMELEEVQFIDGEKYKDDYGEEHVNVKFKVEEQGLQKLRQNLEKMGNEISELSRESGIWEDLKEKKIENYYSCFAQGKKAKTVIVNIYIATNNAGEYYLYVFY